MIYIYIYIPSARTGICPRVAHSMAEVCAHAADRSDLACSKAAVASTQRCEVQSPRHTPSIRMSCSSPIVSEPDALTHCGAAHLRRIGALGTVGRIPHLVPPTDRWHEWATCECSV